MRRYETEDDYETMAEREERLAREEHVAELKYDEWKLRRLEEKEAMNAGQG